MEIIKEIDGMRVEFGTQIQDTRGSYPQKLINFHVIGGGWGVAEDWTEALEQAHLFVKIAREDIARHASV